MSELRGPCDCPPCQAGDEDRCVWLAVLRDFVESGRRAQVAADDVVDRVARAMRVTPDE